MCTTRFREARAIIGVIEARLNAEMETEEQWVLIARQAEELARLARKQAREVKEGARS